MEEKGTMFTDIQNAGFSKFVFILIGKIQTEPMTVILKCFKRVK